MAGTQGRQRAGAQGWRQHGQKVGTTGSGRVLTGRRLPPPPCPSPPQDWEAKQKEQRERILAGWKPEDEEDKEEEEDDELPFACFICRRPWVEVDEPVVTRCKHYFCLQCALQHNAKSKKCAVCEQPTSGIFNAAHDITKREKARAAKAAAAAEVGGDAAAVDE